MNLLERYKRLTLWNKISFWGSLCSIIGVMLWLFTSRCSNKAVKNSERISIESQKLLKTLSPQEEKLLNVIYKYQKELGLNKLIIGRSNGKLHFDEKEKREKYNINIINEVFDVNSDFEKYINELENLILNIPSDYLKNIPEMRLGSPYVIKITKEGITYINRKNNL